MIPQKTGGMLTGWKLGRRRAAGGAAELRTQVAAAGGELSTQHGVLKQQRRQQGRRDREELGAQILDVPLQLHPPVLEPRFDLQGQQHDLLYETLHIRLLNPDNYG